MCSQLEGWPLRELEVHWDIDHRSSVGVWWAYSHTGMNWLTKERKNHHMTQKQSVI